MPTSQLQTLANTVAAILKERSETISIAESSTGGLLSAALLSVPGASAYYGGGSVVYTSPARELYLGINFDDHPGMRSASEPYAALLAKTSRKLLNTTWGLSETGAAGPTGNAYGDTAGHTCVAVSNENIEIEATFETGENDRERNMQTFAITALELLQKALQET
ncbi:MAG: CinA family protein [Chloroflexi bacterium]|jgi:PncC family amidohydrolase|nr:CinA family protein [Chloroflexota bacterium]MBT4141842.1 CinA family protein [Chloroflexota bacterium]MBT4942892.1 CinA family protein [Chloroflexota bacterium]MBT5252028.1 CinA family protein [Chloroflexota bacterium]MBT5476221.1 CinA family protein [Chloroflexota bacterium]